MFCGDHNRTDQDITTCTFYLDIHDNQKVSVVVTLPDEIDSNSILSIKLGSEQNSFCGNVKKFLAFSNTTYYQTLSSPSPCPLAIGLISPICLQSVKEIIQCGAAQYFDSVNNECEGNYCS